MNEDQLERLNRDRDPSFNTVVRHGSQLFRASPKEVTEWLKTNDRINTDDPDLFVWVGASRTYVLCRKYLGKR